VVAPLPTLRKNEAPGGIDGVRPVPKCKSGPSRLRATRYGLRRRSAFYVDESTAMARNSNDRWTPAEDKRLLKLRADGKSNILIAAALRRSLGSVQGRIYLIGKRAAGGAKVTPSDRKRTTWSPADEQRLSEMNAAGASVSEIATAMKRTESAIENRSSAPRVNLRNGAPFPMTSDHPRRPGGGSPRSTWSRRMMRRWERSLRYRLQLPVGSTCAARAAVLMATLADQTSLPWPDEFPRKVERAKEADPA
jgi:hypothetical protein